jgi:hypothetical protein
MSGPKYLKTGGHASWRFPRNWLAFVVPVVLWWIVPSVILLTTAFFGLRQ